MEGSLNIESKTSIGIVGEENDKVTLADLKPKKNLDETKKKQSPDPALFFLNTGLDSIFFYIS